MNCAEIATVINTLVSYGYDDIFSRLEKETGDVKKNAIRVVREIIKETRDIRFEGNSYSHSWPEEAEKRGLPVIRNTPAALKEFSTDRVVTLFSQRRVFTHRELQASVDVKLTEYIKIKDIQIKTALHMVNSLFLPTIQRAIGETAAACRQLGAVEIRNRELTEDLQNLSDLYSVIRKQCTQLGKTEERITALTDNEKKARLYADQGDGELEALRESVDRAERLVADDLWPIPTYQELLIKL
jgi:glutamine synthetase